MSKYIIVAQDRYEVEADNAQQALDSYRVCFEGIEPGYFNLEPKDIINQDGFEYLDGEVRVEGND
jgi:hypothetical protein